jgi:hypothetical protein
MCESVSVFARLRRCISLRMSTGGRRSCICCIRICVHMTLRDHVCVRLCMSVQARPHINVHGRRQCWNDVDFKTPFHYCVALLHDGTKPVCFSSSASTRREPQTPRTPAHSAREKEEKNSIQRWIRPPEIRTPYLPLRRASRQDSKQAVSAGCMHDKSFRKDIEAAPREQRYLQPANY